MSEHVIAAVKRNLAEVERVVDHGPLCDACVDAVVRLTLRESQSSPAVLTCPECPGDGVEYVTYREPCPSCSGSGVVPSPEAVPVVARAIAEALGEGSHRGWGPWEDAARAALGEFLRLNKEEK